jgi:hypothetical protein
MFGARLFGLPDGRSWIAWIRRSSKIVRRVVQAYRNEVLLIEKPGKFKHARYEGDQQRYHRRAFNQRRSLLIPPE